MTEPPVDGLVDIEIGAEVFSKSISTGGGFPAGGVVTAIAVTDDGSFEFSVVRWRAGNGPRHPYIHVFEGDDIDLPATRLTAVAARREAEQLHAWLGKKDQRRLDHHDKAAWSHIALALDEAGSTGTWLPRAEARVAAALEEARRPTPIVVAEPEPSRVEELVENLQRSVDAARAKRKEAS